MQSILSLPLWAWALASLAVPTLSFALTRTPQKRLHVLAPPLSSSSSVRWKNAIESSSSSSPLSSSSSSSSQRSGRWQRLWMADSDKTESKNEDEEEQSSEISTGGGGGGGDDEAKSVSRLSKLKQQLFKKPDDGLTFRQRLTKAGMSVVLSYGWISNVSYSVTVSLAWYIFCKRTGLSPLAPGQWKSFLGVYAGFWVFNNIIRPVRFGVSVAVSMYFDRAVQKIQDKFRVSKGVAVGLTVFLFNIVGTTALMCTGITLAATAAGVPIFPPKV